LGPEKFKEEAMIRLTASILFISLAGCAANGFEKFYTPTPGSEVVRANPAFEKATGELKVFIYSADAKHDNELANEAGYVMIGSSSFYGPQKVMTKEQLRDQAKNVGASMVIIQSKYKDTTSGAIPVAFANQYSATATAIPYSISRNDTVATFWVRRDVSHMHFGAFCGPLPDDLRARLQRNTGLIVKSVVSGTPAFNADVLRGDIILRISGENVTDAASFQKQLERMAGQSISLDILRGDTQKNIEVPLR
jgi:C-terminal processing protease CtpA/Prc